MCHSWKLIIRLFDLIWFFISTAARLFPNSQSRWPWRRSGSRKLCEVSETRCRSPTWNTLRTCVWERRGHPGKVWNAPFDRRSFTSRGWGQLPEVVAFGDSVLGKRCIQSGERVSGDAVLHVCVQVTLPLNVYPYFCTLNTRMTPNKQSIMSEYDKYSTYSTSSPRKIKGWPSLLVQQCSAQCSSARRPHGRWGRKGFPPDGSYNSWSGLLSWRRGSSLWTEQQRAWVSNFGLQSYYICSTRQNEITWFTVILFLNVSCVSLWKKITIEI